MTIQNKILLVNGGLTIAATTGLAFATDTFPGNGFFFMFGLIGIIGGLGCFALGLLLLLRKDKSVGRGYLTSGTILLLVGAISYFLLNKY